MNKRTLTEQNNTPKERPNKSQLKRDMQALRVQTEFLCTLREKQLVWLKTQANLGVEVLDALNELKRITHTNAQKRHIQYITKRLSEQSDLDNILIALDSLQNPHILQQQKDKKLEQTLSRLIEGSQEELEQYLNLPALQDKQQFLQLLRNTQKERKSHNPEMPFKEGKQEKKFKALLKPLLN